MASKTVTHFYNEIVFLAAKIGELGLPDQFIEAARTKKEERIEELLDQCEAKYPELWERLLRLYEEYEEAEEPEIFSEEETGEYYKYNPEEIHPLNLCFILMFSEGNMSDVDIFAQDYWRYLSVTLLEKGYKEIGKEVEDASITSLNYNLLRAYGH